MEENLGTSFSYAPSEPEEPVAPKSNEDRIVEALESIASELFHIRRQFDSVISGGSGFADRTHAIRTTGR